MSQQCEPSVGAAHTDTCHVAVDTFAHTYTHRTKPLANMYNNVRIYVCMDSINGLHYHRCPCAGLPCLLTGAPPAGPRVDGTGTFVPHSLLGEVEDFTAELQKTVSETTFNRTVKQLSVVSAAWSNVKTSISCHQRTALPTLFPFP